MAGDLSLGRAVLSLATDNAQLTTGVDQARDRVSGLGGSIGTLRSGLSSLGSLMAGAFAATAIISAGKAALDYAGRISDLSNRLRISTDTAQEWEATFGAGGVSLEAVAKAAGELTTKLVGGDKSAVSALTKMGLSVEALRAMKPEERLVKVADAVGRIQDEGEQLFASKTLFGKGGAEMLSVLDGHLEEQIAQMRELGVVIDSETLAAADAFGDQLSVMGKQLMAIVATVVGPLLPAVTELGRLLMWLGNNVIGPVLTVTVKGAITVLTTFWERLAQLLARAADLGAMLPGVGEKFKGISAWLKTSAERSAEYSANLWQQKAATASAGDAAATARPKLLGLGDATDVAGRLAKKAADDQKRWTDSIVDATEKAGLSTFALNRWGQVTVPQATSAIGANRDALVAWVPTLAAATDGTSGLGLSLEELQRQGRFASAVLVAMTDVLTEMPVRTRTAAEAYRAELDGMGTSTRTLGQHVGEFFRNIPQKLGAIQEGLATKLSGLFGAKPDSLFSSVISGGLSFIFGPAAGLATQLIGKGMEAIGHVVLGGLKKIGGFFRDLFGGPSKDELAGRQLVAAFESNLSQMLTQQQRLEVGNDAWKGTIIALRDSYLAMGLTAEEAERDAARLWASSRDGAEAARRVIEEIQRRLGQGIRVPVTMELGETTIPVVPMARGGLGRVTQPTLFLAGESGPEDVAFGGRRGLFDLNQARGGTAILEVDGRVVAEVAVPHIFGVVQRFGLARG